MADLYWVGGTNTVEEDWATAANWRNQSDDTTASNPPQSDDNVLIDDRALASITTSMDQSSVDLQSLRVTGGFGRGMSIGTEADPLEIDVSNETTSTPSAVLAPSGASLWLATGSAGWDQTSIERTADGRISFSGGTFTEVVMQAGSVSAVPDCTLVNVYMVGGILVVGEKGSATDPTLIEATGGRVFIQRPSTALHVSGAARVTVERNAAPTTYAQRGGRCEYKGGSITNFTYLGGEFMPSGAARSFTLGSSSGRIVLGSPGRFIDEVPGIDITIGGSVQQDGKRSL